jgi:hypothetical protein
MSLRKKYPFGPDANDRVEIYALSDDPGLLMEKFLDRILCGEEKSPLTSQEYRTLCKYRAGEFRRGRGERLSSERAAEATAAAVARYRQLRAEDSSQSEAETIERVCAETGIDSNKLSNALHRSRASSTK